MRQVFALRAMGTTASREVVAGATTFLTMAYIIFVNPQILSATGMDRGALVTVTILATAFGTLLAALWANVPFAMAPGMGLNAMFTYTLVLGEGLAWQTALGVVFISGLAFLLLTVLGVRERVVNAIPLSLRLGVAAGIGLFITFIGCQQLGLVQAHEETLVTLGEITPLVLVGLAGLALIAVLEVRRVPGSLLIGILFTSVLAWLLVPDTAPTGLVSLPPSPAPIALELDIGAALQWGLLGAIFSFMFVDLFDSVGSIMACSYEAGLVREDGTVRKIDRVLKADAVATLAGALLGTSTTTTYIESGAGIAAGGRTGLTSVVTAGLFLAALFFTPLAVAVPAVATAPALIVVGVYMFRNIRRIDFSDLGEGIPAFLTIILMPFTYSISLGIAFGFLSYIVLAVAAGRWRRVSPVLWIIGALSAAELALRGSALLGGG